jgi:hypothetical protein
MDQYNNRIKIIERRSSKRKLLFLIAILFFLLIIRSVSYSVLHPFSIVSEGNLTSQENNGDFRRTYYYNIQNISSLPTFLLNYELSGYSGIRLINKEIESGRDENMIQLICDTKIENNISFTNPKELHLSYRILIFKLKQTIELNSVDSH